MIIEPPLIEKLARALCKLREEDPDGLRSGKLAYHSSFDFNRYLDGEYDLLFKKFPEKQMYGPDGATSDGDNEMFIWRDYVHDAVTILDDFEIRERKK